MTKTWEAFLDYYDDHPIAWFLGAMSILMIGCVSLAVISVTWPDFMAFILVASMVGYAGNLIWNVYKRAYKGGGE